MLDLDQAIRQRHSTRMFLPRPVPRELVDEALGLAQYAPSNSNIQPWHMVFASGPPRDRLVAALVDEAKHRPPNIPLQFGICTRQLGGPLLDAALQLRMEFELPGLPEENKYPYLGQQKLGDDWHRQVVNRPVATVGVGQRDCRDKNDRGVLKARMIADHPSEFKTVELRHADIAENDSDVLLKEVLEGLSGGPGFDQVFSEALQCRLVAEELRRLIVDKQNVNRILGHGSPLPVKP
jgi:nitroreductase